MNDIGIFPYFHSAKKIRGKKGLLQGLEVKKKRQKSMSKDFADGFVFNCLNGGDKGYLG